MIQFELPYRLTVKIVGEGRQAGDRQHCDLKKTVQKVFAKVGLPPNPFSTKHGLNHPGLRL